MGVWWEMIEIAYQIQNQEQNTIIKQQLLALVYGNANHVIDQPNKAMRVFWGLKTIVKIHGFIVCTL